MARPATGKTPVRGIRVADGLWAAAQDKAAAEGRSMTDVITDYLRRYVAAPPRPGGPPPPAAPLTPVTPPPTRAAAPSARRTRRRS